MPHHDKGQDKANPVQVERHLTGVDYPTTKDKLIETAKNQGADDRIIQTLQQIPDREYDAPTTVTEEIGNLS